MRRLPVCDRMEECRNAAGNVTESGDLGVSIDAASCSDESAQVFGSSRIQS